MSRHNGYGWGGYRPYVPVAQRRRHAAAEVQRARTRGETFEPVRIQGRTIATTAWGRTWCDHIESFRDYENRLPRGRTYVRNGSVMHLGIRTGEIDGRVVGSEIYTQRIRIEPCKPAVWKRVRKGCAGSIGSMIELLEGRISSEVMAAMTVEKDGLLPDLRHVRMECSCPDWASLCKHLAALLYGVGARLDERPELLFLMRGVNPAELVDSAVRPGQTSAIPAGTRTVEGDLGAVFGIDIDDDADADVDADADEQSAASPTKARPGNGRAGKQRPVEPGAAKPRPPKKAAKNGAKNGAKSERPASKQAARTNRAERRAKVTAPTSSGRRTPRARTVRRRDLLQAGVPAGTIGTWLHQGILHPSDERGVYIHTPLSRARLALYGE